MIATEAMAVLHARIDALESRIAEALDEAKAATLRHTTALQVLKQHTAQLRGLLVQANAAARITEGEAA